MDGRLGDLDLPPTAPVRPTQLGRGLPVPPVVALVAVVAVFAGIAFGYGIAPKPAPLPSSSPTTATVSVVESPSPPGSPAPSLAPTPGPTPEPTPSANDLPPAGGLSLSEALAALNENLKDRPESLLAIGPNVPESAVYYARVERYGDLPSLVESPEEWVWAVAIRGSFQPAACRSSQPSPQPCPGPSTTAMVILNYNTGAVLVTWSPAFP